MLSGWTTYDVAGIRVDRLVGSSSYTLLDLHPVGGELASDNPVLTALAKEHQLTIIAPWGGTSWWSDRLCDDFSKTITAEQFLIQHLMPWCNRPPGSLAVTGISMGGQGAVRLGFKYPERFPVVASIAGAFDYHEWHGLGTSIDSMYRSREACRQDTAVLQVSPLKYPRHIWLACDPVDEWHRGNDRLHEKLSAIGIAHETDFQSSHGGHCWDYFHAMTRPMVQFCLTALQKESRRLV